jgi:predicted transcriptional regulator
MDPVATLDAVAEKVAPGRAPAYTSAQVLKAIELIACSGMGRQQLAGRLGIGEGSARTIVKRLMAEGLISTTKGGMALTEKGERLVIDVHNLIRGSELRMTGVTVGVSDYAVLVKGASRCVKLGVEQRDSALIAGAKGATTLVFDGVDFRMPGVDVEPEGELSRSLMSALSPMKGDVVIIGTADTPIDAEIGAKSSALGLLRACKVA